MLDKNLLGGSIAIITIGLTSCANNPPYMAKYCGQIDGYIFISDEMKMYETHSNIESYKNYAGNKIYICSDRDNICLDGAIKLKISRNELENRKDVAEYLTHTGNISDYKHDLSYYYKLNYKNEITEIKYGSEESAWKSYKICGGRFILR
jgi:hypothetical protein